MTKTTRTQWILGGTLLLQLALILIFRSPFSSAAGAVEARPLFPSLAAITALRIELTGSGGRQLTLAREGDHWTIDGLDGFPADDARVDTLLQDLSNLKVRRPVVASSRYHESFKVDEESNEGRVRVFGDGHDDPDVDLIVGTAPNYRTLHVRAGDEDGVYEVQGLTAYDLQPTGSSWIARDLIDLGGDEVNGIVVTNASGSFELARQDGAWAVVAPAGATAQPLDPIKVDTLVRNARSIRLADAAGKTDPGRYGFSDPVATVVLRSGDEVAREIVVQIGGTVEGRDTQRYVTRAGWGFTGTVQESSVSALIGQTLSDLTAGS